ncbi:DUF5666 domain-containing protein [Actinoallomurus purpureus]|uniref:DUF5666 domain-containing protein n=1 Tax=Actinoallomurus purpureus TaxID=478114 RepID=UPI002093A657|nr:DUF5666 domain-containing protein [Actinoallomurus purpureus]MCO6004291.1 DUF5666 domain-containing protein [Actinoallomurus purpureus]
MSGRRTWTSYDEPGAHPASVTRDDVLSTSPFDGDLETELAKAPKSRKLPGLTTYLGAGALVAAGFGVGAQVDRHFGDHTTTAAQTARTMPGGGMPGGGMPGRSGTGQGQNTGRASGGTTGTVQKVAGKTVYVRTADGVVRVTVTGTTKVHVLRSGSASALKTGANVTVQGTQAKDGTLTATSVTQGTSSGG